MVLAAVVFLLAALPKSSSIRLALCGSGGDPASDPLATGVTFRGICTFTAAPAEFGAAALASAGDRNVFLALRLDEIRNAGDARAAMHVKMLPFPLALVSKA